MSVTHDFYSLRADEARATADLAQLDNVRDRHLGAAAAWDVLAARAARTDRGRAETEARKAAAALDADEADAHEADEDSAEPEAAAPPVLAAS